MKNTHKIMRTVVASLCLVLSAVSLCGAGQIGYKIGPFNLREWITEAQLVGKYGEGYVAMKVYEGASYDKKHIYYDRAHNVWVEIRMSHVLDEEHQSFVEEVFVTRNKLCDQEFKPNKPFTALVTSKGIKIGDSMEKVIKVYGMPSDMDKFVDVDGQAFRYGTRNENELGMEVFHFKNSKVHSMLVSVLE